MPNSEELSSHESLKEYKINRDKSDRNHAIGWSIFIVPISIIIGYYLAPFMVFNIWVGIFFSITIWGVPTYVMRQQYSGRACTGGMDFGPLIALGILMLSWAGATAHMYGAKGILSYVYVIISILFAVGVFSVYRGLKEGPVYGWENS